MQGTETKQIATLGSDLTDARVLKGLKIIDLELAYESLGGGRLGPIIGLKAILGSKNLTTWTGDEWRKRNYAMNAGRVHPEYQTALVYIIPAPNAFLYRPCDGYVNSPWSMNQQLDREIPCFICSDTDTENHPEGSFTAARSLPDTKQIYLGDSAERLLELPVTLMNYIVSNTL